MGIVERKQREKKRRKSDIKKAARKVFREKGYKKATMNDIAEYAQLSPGTLYLYFENKEELYASLSIDMIVYMTEQVSEVLEMEAFSIEEKLAGVNSIFVEMYDYDAKVLINLFHLQSADTLDRLSPQIIQQMKDASSKSHKALASIIQEGMDQGLFQKEHPVAVADIIWGLFSGVILWVESKHQLNQGKNFAKETFETAFNIFLKGLKSK
jgi:AcrR family transcriptional regulator